MSAFQVTASELKRKAQELKDHNGKFKTEVGRLEGYEQSLASMWEGDAQKAFRTAFNNDKTQMDNFYNAIEQYIQSLLTIAAKYEQAESMNAEIANKRSH